VAVDPDKVGMSVAGVTVHHMDDLPTLVAEKGIAIGIIATPASAAQGVSERMVDAGVTSILNFSASVLNLDAEVSVRKVDLAVELQILSFYKRRADGPGTVGPDALAGSDS
jgi:redox-sensing transcriptional repressor